MKKQPGQSKKKISLSKETLRILAARDLGRVMGASITTESCAPTENCTITCDSFCGC
jgi:hypothetical protein